MKPHLRTHWPLWAALLILWTAVGAFTCVSIRLNDGHLVYALDDPYIHIAMAKNFARHGIWGITRYGFTSSSSSLLWTLILSFIYRAAGVNDATPLILNVLFATLLLLAAYRLLPSHRRPSPPPAYTFMAVAGIMLFTPLLPLIFCGQEHVLHALVTILFVFAAARSLSVDGAPPSSLSLIALAAILPLIRYEGLFPVFVVCILLAVRRRHALALALGVAALIPITIYGVISLRHGWYFLPNPVIIKGKPPDLASVRGVINALGGAAAAQLVRAPHVAILTLAAAALCFILRSKGRLAQSRIMLAIFVATALLHAQFARAGWFYRYEAYLIALGIMAIAWALIERLPDPQGFSTAARAVFTTLLIFSISSLGLRGIQAVKKIPRAAANIYQQQYQMGLFLKRFYEGSTVAANDVGAINYLADVRCVDLAGLGNAAVAKAMREGNYTRDKVRGLARSEGVTIAVLYDLRAAQCGDSLIPPEWPRVGQWRIAHNVVCGSDTVSFYAVQPSAEGGLRENLRAFSSLLPPDEGVRSTLYSYSQSLPRCLRNSP